MIKVIFVCLGNICRSPLAEGVFRKLVEDKGWSGQFHIDSAGTAAYHTGKAPDPGSRKVALQQGFSIDDLRARQFTRVEINKWDYIIAMDASNHANLKKLGELGGELWLMRDFDPLQKGGNVPDPWSLGDDAFFESYEIIKRSSERLLDYIAEENRL